jgi:hypothetical protein
MLTIAVILIVSALILAIASAAGKWGPLALPVAVILLAIVASLQYLPLK